MNGDRSDRAKTRISAALARIEKAATSPVRTPNSATSTALAMLEKRHASLKNDAIEALSDLDALIAKAKR
ncbi:MAG: hypothetical protein ABL918_04785 [Chakrabartia sp.]